MNQYKVTFHRFNDERDEEIVLFSAETSLQADDIVTRLAREPRRAEPHNCHLWPEQVASR